MSLSMSPSPAGPVTINGNAFSLATMASSVLGVDLFNATQDLTINAPLVLTGETGFSLSVSATRTLTVNGDISGAGTLTLTGLTGANTYSGGTTVSAGTLQGNTGSLQGDILNNSIVEFNQAADGTYAGVMSGTEELHKSNPLQRGPRQR